MKKLLVLTVFALCSCSIFFQELGVHVGDFLGNNIAIDAMLRSGKFNRLHLDVSFGEDNVAVTITLPLTAVLVLSFDRIFYIGL